MSMLAERKQKQRWVLNPRATPWTQDSSKFGQKMLEKMGWKHGKGLGANESGVTEHIKVSYKNDMKGIGFKDIEGWTDHETHFTELLQNLSETISDAELMRSKRMPESKPVSLEVKSQSSRARVHYRKFIRSKDLSKYSSKDLANIFCKKSLDYVKDKTTENGHKGACETKDDSTSKGNKFGVNTIRGGSMADYFKKKLPSGFAFGNNENNNGDSENNMAGVGFGFNAKEKSTFVSYLNEESGQETPVESTILKKKRKLQAEKTKNEDTVKIKKKKKNLDPRNDLGIANPAFDPLCSNINEETLEVEANGTSFDSKKHKRNKNKVVHPEQTEDIIVKKKKKNLGSHNDVGIANPAFINIQKHILNTIEENEEVETNGTSFESKKHKRNKNKMIPPEQTEDVIPKKEKKRSRNLGVENPVFEENAEDTNAVPVEINPYEVRIKRKKSKKLAIDNPCFVDQNISPDPDVKKKRKTDKNPKANETGLDNPALNLSSTTDTKEDWLEIGSDLILNVTTRETPKRNVLLSCTPSSEPRLRSIIKRRKSVRFSDVNEERIIPNVYDGKNLSHEEFENRRELFSINTKVIEDNLEKQRVKNGDPPETGLINDGFDMNSIDNFSYSEDGAFVNNGFDARANSMEENIESIAKTIDMFQAEVENDMNEAKVTKRVKKVNQYEVRMVGEIGNFDGENEKLPHGTKLKFKYADFGRMPGYMYRKDVSAPKRSYRHLIQGDIIVQFKNTNLHEITGYAKNKMVD